ncbi:MAG: MarR family transcriptional regulator [Pseudomonadales bacterium]|nr:MarR family transcriptional regulator [Pseudomonadales bacterium]
MKTMKIGIMPRKQFQQRILDIAAGRHIPKRGEPKVWFSSMKSLSEVLSDNNVQLLQLIEEHHPETLKELAELSGRQQSNLNRTLKTMERYGIVELKKTSKFVRPVVKASSFSIVYGIAS